MKGPVSRLTLVILALAIAMCGRGWTWARPTAALLLVTASTDQSLVSEDDKAEGDADDHGGRDDASEGEFECVAPLAALIGPVCVRMDGVGEGVLFA